MIDIKNRNPSSKLRISKSSDQTKVKSHRGITNHKHKSKSKYISRCVIWHNRKWGMNAPER